MVGLVARKFRVERCGCFTCGLGNGFKWFPVKDFGALGFLLARNELLRAGWRNRSYQDRWSRIFDLCEVGACG